MQAASRGNTLFDVRTHGGGSIFANSVRCIGSVASAQRVNAAKREHLRRSDKYVDDALERLVFLTVGEFLK